MKSTVKTTTDSATIANTQDAEVNYLHLISAIIDAGFGINTMTPQRITEQDMTYNCMPIEVEHPENTENSYLFTVIYQPVDNLFYYSSSKNISIVFGEKRTVDQRLSVLNNELQNFAHLMYPSLQKS